MEHITPTVGLMTLAGCLTFLIAPDDQPGSDPRTSAALSADLPTIIIDAGHGGNDEGARSNGLVEKQLTLDLALRLEKCLQDKGFRTVLTRRDDSYVSLPARIEIANKFDYSLFVSLHFNKSGYSSVSGIETFYASEKVLPEPAWSFAGLFPKREPVPSVDRGGNFAGLIQAALVTRMEASNRGIKGHPLYVVRHTKMPAVLVEGGFMSNPFEARLLATPEYRDRLAASLTEGIVQYSKTMPKPANSPAQLAKASP
jgi:N-acetylmuramoyl-L-alanine amidase